MSWSLFIVGSEIVALPVLRISCKCVCVVNSQVPMGEKGVTEKALAAKVSVNATKTWRKGLFINIKFVKPELIQLNKCYRKWNIQLYRWLPQTLCLQTLDRLILN